MEVGATFAAFDSLLYLLPYPSCPSLPLLHVLVHRTNVSSNPTTKAVTGGGARKSPSAAVTSGKSKIGSHLTKHHGEVTYVYLTIQLLISSPVPIPAQRSAAAVRTLGSVSPQAQPQKPQSVTALIRERLSEPCRYHNTEKVLVRFNHYRKEFPLHNRVLKWEDIDSQYAISFVYRGAYGRKIYQSSSKELEHGSTMNARQYELSDEKGDYFLLDRYIILIAWLAHMRML